MGSHFCFDFDQMLNTRPTQSWPWDILDRSTAHRNNRSLARSSLHGIARLPMDPRARRRLVALFQTRSVPPPRNTTQNPTCTTGQLDFAHWSPKRPGLGSLGCRNLCRPGINATRIVLSKPFSWIRHKYTSTLNNNRSEQGERECDDYRPR